MKKSVFLKNQDLTNFVALFLTTKTVPNGGNGLFEVHSV